MADINFGKWLTGEIRKLRILRHDPRALLVWPLVCIVSGCLLWGATLYELGAHRSAVEGTVFRQASSLSDTYAEQLSRSVEQIDQITLNLKYYWQKTPGAVDLQEQLLHGLYPATAQIFVTIVGRDGRAETSTLETTSGSPGIAHRDYFLAHKNDPSLGLLISQPVIGLRLKIPVILFSRRLDAADGSFNGLVVVAIKPAYLASIADGSSLAESDFIAVHGSAGALLAAKASDSKYSLTSHFRSPPVFNTDKGVVRMAKEKFVDDDAHIVAWHKLKNNPLVAIVGISEKKAFAAYRENARELRLMATAGSVFLLLMAMFGIHFSLQLAWRKHQEEKVKNTYRLATDGAREGFYMVRALYGQGNGAVDFIVEDCNEQGAAYYGTTRAKLVGTKLSESSTSERSLHELMATFCRAMETGFHEDTFRVPPQTRLQASWVHWRIVRSGDGLAVTVRDISDIKANEEILSRLANADTVTSLPNRHWLMNYLPIAVEQARGAGTRLAVLFVDLDDFKNINDTLGHAAGDQLLQAVALRLKSVVRPQDSVVRLGGDEFTLILEHADGGADVSRVADRIVRSFDEPFLLSDQSRHIVYASIGISLFPQDGHNGETLLKHADIAMYAAKANGKRHYQFFQPQLATRLVARLNQEQALRQAIERDEFVLHYQPRVDTFSGELRGMESLVRWLHPERGLVAPNDFIPMAEETGLIVPLGEMVIQKVCAQLAQWKAQDLPVVPVSINVSPRQFNHGNLSTLLASCMSRHGIAASLIEIEITESCMVGEDHTVTKELAAIEALGIKLLVDDFGTGYSSLSQLKRLDMNGLKVDRAFTSQLGNGCEDEAFFRAILSMAHALGMSVVAEGVETVEQLRVLQGLSCDEVQGYLISRPLPAAEIPPLLLKRFHFPPELQPVCPLPAYPPRPAIG